MDLQLAGRPHWSPAARRASAGRWSRGWPPRARGSRSARAPRPTSRRPRPSCAAAGGDVAGTAVDVADGAALDGLGGRVGGALRRHRRGGGQRQRAGHRAGRGELAHGFEVDLMHTVRLCRGRDAAPGGERRGSIVAVSSVSGREIDFADGAYGDDEGARSCTTCPGLALQTWRPGIRANACRPATPTSPAASGRAIETRQPGAVRHGARPQPDRPDGHPAGGRLRGRSCWPARGRPFISGTNLVVDGALTRGVQL